jgi:hypothetical protein
MRRYLRCPGAICCPERRALRVVLLQPHPVLRRADHRRVEPTAPRMRRLSPPAGCDGCSVRGKPGRCLRVRTRCLRAFSRGRSTGLGVAGFAIRSHHDRHRPRASPRCLNGPTRARLKPSGSPAATRMMGTLDQPRRTRLSNLHVAISGFFERFIINRRHDTKKKERERKLPKEESSQKRKSIPKTPPSKNKSSQY